MFGSPFFIVDGESFFGLEKMELMEEWLATGGWQIRWQADIIVCCSACVFDADLRSNPLTFLGSKGSRFHTKQQACRRRLSGYGER